MLLVLRSRRAALRWSSLALALRSLRALLGTMTLRSSSLLHPHRQTVVDAESV